MQNTSVLAMGVKYFPSIPFNVRMGKKTIRIINTAKVAERATPIQRQISCNIQKDKKMCVNANIYSI